MPTRADLCHTNIMAKEKPARDSEKTGFIEDQDYSQNASERPSLVLPFLLFINLILIISILIVSSLWASVRGKNEMEMIPAPDNDRSICVPEKPGGSCISAEPEMYISKQIDQKIRKSHMQFMADKLNYANVVCRKNAPSVYLYKGIQSQDSQSGRLIWKSNNEHHNRAEPSVEYDTSTGLLKFLRSGDFFIYSQITEKAENAANSTFMDIYLTTNGITEKLLESVSDACKMVSAVSVRSHYVGSAFQFNTGDTVFVKHSNPRKIQNFDTFLGIRELAFPQLRELG